MVEREQNSKGTNGERKWWNQVNERMKCYVRNRKRNGTWFEQWIHKNLLCVVAVERDFHKIIFVVLALFILVLALPHSFICFFLLLSSPFAEKKTPFPSHNDNPFNFWLKRRHVCVWIISAHAYTNRRCKLYKQHKTNGDIPRDMCERAQWMNEWMTKNIKIPNATIISSFRYFSSRLFTNFQIANVFVCVFVFCVRFAHHTMENRMKIQFGGLFVRAHVFTSTKQQQQDLTDVPMWLGHFSVSSIFLFHSTLFAFNLLLSSFRLFCFLLFQHFI